MVRREGLDGHAAHRMTGQHHIAQIEVAERELEASRRELERLRELVKKATSESEVDGQKTLVVSLTGDKVPDRKLYVAAATGLILKEENVVLSDAVGEVPITITYSDYRKVNGIQLPFKTVSENPFVGEFLVQFETAEALTELPKDAFVVPPPEDR